MKDFSPYFQIPTYASLPTGTAPHGALISVNGTLHMSDGTSWNPVASSGGNPSPSGSTITVWEPRTQAYTTALEIGKNYRIDPTDAGEAEAILPVITPAMYGQSVRVMKAANSLDSVYVGTNGTDVIVTRDYTGQATTQWDTGLLATPYSLVKFTATSEGWLVTERASLLIEGAVQWNAVPRGYAGMLRDSLLRVADDGGLQIYGGNQTAAGAFDLQTARTNGTFFAAGPNSAILGGQNNKTGAGANFAGMLGGSTNTANGFASAVVGGQSNQATGGLSAVLGGTNNVASGYSTTVIGYGNTASGNYCAVLGGQNNVASSSYTTVLGGYNNQAKASAGVAHGNSAVASRSGERAYANGSMAAAGDSQGTESVHFGTTNGSLGEGQVLTGSNFTIPANQNHAVAFEAQIVAANATDTARLTVTGLIRRIGTGTATFVGTPTVTRTHASSGASTWTVTPTLSNVAGQPSALGFTGKATANVSTRWVTTLRTVESVF